MEVVRMALKVGELYASFGIDTSSLNNAISGIEKKCSEIAGSLAKTGAVLSTAITAPIVAFGKDVFNVGTEFEAQWFLHNMARHTADNDLRRDLAVIRRAEQQEQKKLSYLKPKDESILETTIAYEQLAVELTAMLARKEKNMTVRRALDFALLEDFDHLYRYADLLEMDSGIRAETLVGKKTEIMPGHGDNARSPHCIRAPLSDGRHQKAASCQCAAFEQTPRDDNHRSRAADHEPLHELRHVLRGERDRQKAVPRNRHDRGAARFALRVRTILVRVVARMPPYA